MNHSQLMRIIFWTTFVMLFLGLFGMFAHAFGLGNLEFMQICEGITGVSGGWIAFYTIGSTVNEYS
jgi:hypothetical protein